MGSDDPRMLHDSCLRRVHEALRGRGERLRALRTREQAERYVMSVRRKLRSVFGSLSEPRLLGARTTGTLEQDGFRLEKVLLESRPGHYLTGNLYLPSRDRGVAQRPGILGLCGHSPVGKAEPAYQIFCRELALKGFVVLIVDPISQGERPQFFASEGAPVPDLCWGHNAIGNQLALVGDFFGSWRLRDALSALDYLLSRPEVDASRVGVTGNSGGGTITSYLAAVDRRITMAAPGCFIGSYEANLRNELPADSEQNPPGMIAAGLDQADLLIAGSPRPTLILSQRHDFFDERSARTAWEELRRIHRLLGSRNTARYFCGPRDHGYHRENREAMYAFFQEFADVAVDPGESGRQPLDPSSLLVAPGTANAGGKLVREFVHERAGALQRARPVPRSADDVARRARRVLGVPIRRGTPPHRCLTFLDNRTEEGKPRQIFAVETEPGIEAYITLFGPPHLPMRLPEAPVLAYVCHEPWEQELAATPELRQRIGSAALTAVVDPRGMGRSFSATCGSTSLFEPYGSDFLYASVADMLGESLLGRRVFDLLLSMDYLLSSGATRVDLAGRGVGSIVVAFAALLHGARPAALLIDYLPSFSLLAAASRMWWPLSSLPRGVLSSFDLPDIYRAVGRRLTLRRPLDATMKAGATTSLKGA